mmetsp:Transcript_17065/g.28394  ORF Transcript_17065/g.28394 Transcript_17065/m.28394 type:complete len:308 (+) Transcript_17065:39-962(+)
MALAARIRQHGARVAVRSFSALSQQYREDGYLVIPNVVSKAERNVLLDEIVAVAKGSRGDVKGLVAASQQSSDEDIIRKYLAFHHPHKLSELLLETGVKHPEIVKILREIVSPNVKCMQSMFFVKAPGKPGQAWHQDEIYIPTRDRSLIGAWIALDDATIENGCLWIHPGSHKAGVLYPMSPHADPRFDPTGMLHSFPYDGEGGVPVECPAGSVVFFNGYVVHRSLPNKTDGFRRAYVMHYMSAESLLPWDCDGTIPATSDNRDVILVAGTDPHAHKGYETGNTFPFVRPDTGPSSGKGASFGLEKE